MITGKYLKGRNEIVTYHAGLFTGDFQGSPAPGCDLCRSPVSPVLTSRFAQVGTKRTENEGKEMRTSFPMFVLTKEGKSWLIAAVQNTLTSGPPVPPIGTPK